MYIDNLSFIRRGDCKGLVLRRPRDPKYTLELSRELIEYQLYSYGEIQHNNGLFRKATIGKKAFDRLRHTVIGNRGTVAAEIGWHLRHATEIIIWESSPTPLPELGQLDPVKTNLFNNAIDKVVPSAEQLLILRKQKYDFVRI